ncbi:MAG: tetratricopeptide repeat protein [Acidobacteriota bacterium]|nr:tetratricopeptide repeat protein [Acidobacteriota bacterium]
MTLIAAFVATGFASSAYHRERTALGVEHYHLGRSLESHDELESALDEYRKALFFAPDKTEYRLSLATALIEAGRLDEAQSHLEQLSQDDPTNGVINLLLGRIAVQRRKLKQAVDFYQRAVYEYWPEADLPQRRQARWELANLLSQTGDRNGFIGELMQLYTNLPPTETAQKLKVGSLLLTNGATSEASRIFQDLAKQQPLNPQARRGLGEAYFSSGDYIAARHELQRALRLDPKDQASAQTLALTNEVIDMDAALPYITASEQLRRSKNLLGRVIRDLDACQAANAVTQPAAVSGKKADMALADPLAQEWSIAQTLATQKRNSEDAALAMQRAAAQLWTDKARFCSSGGPRDRALDTVFARIGHE